MCSSLKTLTFHFAYTHKVRNLGTAEADSSDEKQDGSEKDAGCKLLRSGYLTAYSGILWWGDSFVHPTYLTHFYFSSEESDSGLFVCRMVDIYLKFEIIYNC